MLASSVDSFGNVKSAQKRGEVAYRWLWTMHLGNMNHYGFRRATSLQVANGPKHSCDISGARFQKNMTGREFRSLLVQVSLTPTKTPSTAAYADVRPSTSLGFNSLSAIIT